MNLGQFKKGMRQYEKYYSITKNALEEEGKVDSNKVISYMDENRGFYFETHEHLDRIYVQKRGIKNVQIVLTDKNFCLILESGEGRIKTLKKYYRFSTETTEELINRKIQISSLLEFSSIPSIPERKRYT